MDGEDDSGSCRPGRLPSAGPPAPRARLPIRSRGLAHRVLVERQRQRELPAADHAAALLDRANGVLPLLPEPRRSPSACRAAGSTRWSSRCGHIIGVHGARMYYNLTNIHAVLRSAPFGDLLAASFDQFVGSEDTDTPASWRAASNRARPGATALARRQAVELARDSGQDRRGRYLFVTRRVSRGSSGRSTAFAARTHPRLLATQGSPRAPRRLRARSSTSAATAGSTPRWRTPGRWSATARCSACSVARSRQKIRPRSTTACSRRCPGLPAECRRLNSGNSRPSVRADRRLLDLARRRVVRGGAAGGPAGPAVRDVRACARALPGRLGFPMLR